MEFAIGGMILIFIVFSILIIRVSMESTEERVLDKIGDAPEFNCILESVEVEVDEPANLYEFADRLDVDAQIIKVLEANEIYTIAELKLALKDGTKIHGIGPVREKAIKKALKKL